MENVIKDVEIFLEQHPDADFDELDNYLNRKYDEETIAKYYELLSETLGGLDHALENPSDLFFKDQTKEIEFDNFFLIKFPEEEHLRKLKVKEWDLVKTDGTIEKEVEKIFVQAGGINIKVNDESTDLTPGDLLVMKKKGNVVLSTNEKMEIFIK
ncbi:hypothetical protein [Geotoga petraea]|uniref:Uncharacterized protein n=1 Tax=Geotoga petraea TaxID=28234 RepID=A0A1G6IIK5_9BACT|nr:hypothetical protein [Geotoga petraea]MDK2945266.1 uncharacterized protein [Geotoga sp.]TGG89212.1 hypothetical protein E4650_03225 [Geotoga petraea]SDC06281.1 hypothetical protein SAMN04488588_0391 [Geotoga petraea]